MIKGDVAIEQTTEGLDQTESKILDISAEQCSFSAITDDRNGALAEVCDEEESAQCLKLVKFSFSLVFFVVKTVKSFI